MTLRSALVILILALATLPVILFQVVLINLYPPWSQIIPIYWHKLACRVLRIKVRVHGVPIINGSCLFISNHISWLDIPVIGSVVPTSFIAKHEISQWGIFGLMAKLQRSVFVKRGARGEAARQRDRLAERFGEGNRLVLFAEGTSSDGVRVLPFKSALFSVAEQISPRGKPLVVQPITLAYTRLEGLPLRRSQRPWLAWIGDMDLAPHFLEVLNRRGIEARLVFHPPMTVEEAGSRKELADACRNHIARGLVLANTHALI